MQSCPRVVTSYAKAASSTGTAAPPSVVPAQQAPHRAARDTAVRRGPQYARPVIEDLPHLSVAGHKPFPGPRS